MFIQPCFIRKNTSELRRKLEELGYKKGVSPLPVGQEDIYDRDIHLFENKYHFMTYTCYGVKNNINCGTNEEIFLALAALRDDSDYMQWFTNTNDCWYKCLDNKFSKETADWVSCASADKWYKATVEEIIEHFK